MVDRQIAWSDSLPTLQLPMTCVLLDRKNSIHGLAVQGLRWTRCLPDITIFFGLANYLGIAGCSGDCPAPLNLGMSAASGSAGTEAASSLGCRAAGYETIMMNSNPETVSTDYDTSSRLYFEPLTVEDVLNVIDKERPDGIIVQFGGQTPLSLAGKLQAALKANPVPAASGGQLSTQLLERDAREELCCRWVRTKESIARKDLRA